MSALEATVFWQAHAGSARGTSHDRSGAPNQDCGKAVLLGQGTGAVIAVADGHGDSLHPRSDRGSRFAVDAAITVLTDWIKQAPECETSVRSSATELPRRIVADWRAKVTANLEKDPLTEAEIAATPPGKAGLIERSPEVAYGSTLIAAAIDDRLAVYLQVGDGDLLTVGADDAVSRAVVGRNDLPINATESLCQSDAHERFRMQVDFFSNSPKPALLLLATDGYCNSFGDDAAFLKVGRDIKLYLQQYGIHWVAERLEGWLKETSKTGSGDDITLALAWFAQPVQVPPPRPKWWVLPFRALARLRPPAGILSPAKMPWRVIVIGAVVAALVVPLAWLAWKWGPNVWKIAVEIAHPIQDKKPDPLTERPPAPVDKQQPSPAPDKKPEHPAADSPAPVDKQQPSPAPDKKSEHPAADSPVPVDKQQPSPAPDKKPERPAADSPAPVDKQQPSPAPDKKPEHPTADSPAPVDEQRQ